MAKSVLIGMIVFGCTFVGALSGMWLRAVLPAHHLGSDSKDTIKVGIGLIATMTALVLGLITASAKSSYDMVETELRNTAIDILTLDRLLAQYGPETREIRGNLQRSIAYRIDMIWPRNSSAPVQLDPSTSLAGMEALVERIRELTPHGSSQEAIHSRAVGLAESLLKARWIVIAEAQQPIPPPFLAVLLFWLTTTFTSFGLFSPKNFTVLTVLFVCSLSVSSALFLVLEMDTPFEGLLKIPPDSLRYAVAHINQ